MIKMQNFQIKNKVFDTYPAVFHHPGRIGDGNRVLGIVQSKRLFFEVIGDSDNGYFWDRKEGLRLKIPTINSAKVESVSNQLTIVFVSNLKEPGSGPRSLDYFGIPYRILGSTVEKWSNGLKLEFLKKELPNITTKYFMLLDSDDTFVVNDLSRALRIFESEFDCDILLNAGQNLWPNEVESYRSFCDRIGEQSDSLHRYPNTGALLAKTDFYRELVNNFDLNAAPLPGDDQSAFYPLYRHYYPRIQLDHRCKIFQCEFDEELIIESSVLPWYRRQIIHSRSPLYHLLHQRAKLRRKVRHRVA